MVLGFEMRIVHLSEMFFRDEHMFKLAMLTLGSKYQWPRKNESGASYFGHPKESFFCHLLWILGSSKRREATWLSNSKGRMKSGLSSIGAYSHGVDGLTAGSLNSRLLHSHSHFTTTSVGQAWILVSCTVVYFGGTSL